MNANTVMTIIMALCTGLMGLAFMSVRKDLRNTQEKLSDAEAEIITRKNELEVIKSVQDRIREAEGRKKPEYTAPPADAASRTERLNRVPHGSGS